MAKGRYEKPGSGKGGLVLVLIIAMLLIGGLVAGVLYLLNGDGPDKDSDKKTDRIQAEAENDKKQPSLPENLPVQGGDHAAEQPQPSVPTQETVSATEETTVPVEETTSPTEVTTIPTETEATTLPELGEDATVGQKVAQTALAQLGKPYQSGGNGPDSFDTTGFIFYCLKENQLADKRTKLKQLVEQGMEVPREELQPGDVVFFWTSNEGVVEYAGIYVGNGKFVAARNEANPVSEMDMTVNYFATRYLTARRFGN